MKPASPNIGKYSSMDFTIEERMMLQRKGWIVDDGAEGERFRATDGGYRAIVKRGCNFFIVKTWYDDPDTNGWWEYDSEFTTLAETLDKTTKT